jgi:acetolactate synthase-1/2/3 large subunit
MKVCDYISDFLDRAQVTHAFGVSGANIEELFESLHSHNKTKVVLAKTEYSAANMAIGSYLSSKHPAVVLTTSGPGVLNTIPVLAEAYASRIPMLLISGSVPQSLEGMGAFQDTSGKGESFDLMKLLTPCTGYQIKIEDEKEVPNALEEALYYSLKLKKPTVIVVPKNIFSKELSEIHIREPKILIEDNYFLDHAQIFCENFLKKEENPPLIVFGEELLHLKEKKILCEFVEKTSGLVALTPCTKGLFNHHSPQYLGLMGIMGHEEVNQYLQKTNHIILLGTSFDFLTRLGHLEHLTSKNILIIKNEKDLGLFSFVAKDICEVYGDVEKILQQLTQGMLEQKENYGRELSSIPETFNYDLKNIIDEISPVIKADSDIFIDAGNTGATVIHHLKPKGEGLCYVALGMGGMGNSIGMGLGSAFSSGKRTFIFLGDGSFLMYGLEIHTANEHNLPVTFFVLNNSSHGMCTTRENLFLSGATGINDFKESFFAEGIEKMFPGVLAYEVYERDSLIMALSASEYHLEKFGGPCVISINIPNTDNPPFKTFIKK